MTRGPIVPDPPACGFVDADAAYVLGALDPAEQQAFRSHLPGCAHCREAVAELVAMPGLLARLLPEGETDPEPPAQDAASDVLPELVHRVQTERRLARWRARFTGFLAAAALGIGALLITAPVQQDPDRVLTMDAAPGVPVSATLQVTGRGWGTSIDTTCRYEGERRDRPSEAGVTYELWAVGADGQEVLVSSWQQSGGDEVTVPGSTRLGLADIDRLEVRSDEGTPILISRP